MRKTAIQERLKQYKARHELYLKAEMAILEGAQSYTIGTRTLTRADLAEIRKMITTLEEGIDEMSGQLSGSGRRKAMRVIPRDV